MNRSHILQALQHNPENRFAPLHNHPLSVHSQFIANNSEELRREIATLRASVVRPETRQAIEQWAGVSNNFGMALIDEAMRAIEGSQWDQANDMLGKKINPVYAESMKAYRISMHS